MIVKRDQCAHHKRNCRAHNSVQHAALDVVVFERQYPVLDQFHSPWLSASHQHVHLGFQSSQLFQDFCAKLLSLTLTMMDSRPSTTSRSSPTSFSIVFKTDNPHAMRLSTANISLATSHRIAASKSPVPAPAELL